MGVGKYDVVFFPIDGSTVGNKVDLMIFQVDGEQGFFHCGCDHFIFVEDGFVEVL